MNQTLNTEETLERLQGDVEFLGVLFNTFLEDYDERLETIATAVHNRELEDLARMAHSLKGVCGTVGAERLKACALDLELAARSGSISQSEVTHSQLINEAETLRETLDRWLAEHE